MAKSRTRKKHLNHQQFRILIIAIASLVVVTLLASIGWFAYWQHKKDLAISAQNQIAAQYDFNPGLIISDNNFFDSKSMTEEQIQKFLEERGSKCTGSNCIAQLRVDTTNQAKDAECAAYKGTQGERVSTIIAKSASACQISPKVLLTILQKEQHLVTATEPTDFQIEAAMGLSCPDHDSCDPKFAGIFKQIFGAAKRFRYYANHMSEYNYAPYSFNDIAYNPNAQCGSSSVYIENQATALLYIYTPYQPNLAALKAGSGEGDSCSAYGNRNFSLIYANWFGSPR